MNGSTIVVDQSVLVLSRVATVLVLVIETSPDDRATLRP
jgi:hypothetical protein